MKHKSILSILALLLFTFTTLPLAAQLTEEVRSTHYFSFPQFRKAKVIQPFGKFVEVEANVFLKDASLCFLAGDTIKKAYLDKVIAVKFDSVEYRTINKTMLGEVIATKNYNYLLRVRTIDMERFTKETDGSENGAFFEFDGIGRMSNTFIDLNSDNYRKEGYPLKDKYYFIVKGRAVVASESHIRREVSHRSLDKFKAMMNDRWWSWRDEESLIMLLDLLPY